MKVTLDLKAMECPRPVIETQKAFKDENATEFEITVDNLTAKENLKRLATSKGYQCEITENGNEIKVLIKRDSSKEIQEQEFEAKCEETTTDQNDLANTVLMITNEFMGQGNDELGKVLMKGFLYTITETKPYPAKVVLLNSGIKLSTENEETIVHLKKLEEAGTKIYSCGTCLNYYDLADSLKVGIIGNMYDVVESLTATTNRITI